MTLKDLESRFISLSAERNNYRDQELGIIACSEALASARTGNYGVGAVLADPEGIVLEQSGNEAIYPHFRSDFHAEMIVMNAFENRYPDVENMKGYTLLCSLEPCPMCLARLLINGVQTVKFLAVDELGGMVSHLNQFPVAWKRLAKRQQFVQAEVSEGLRKFALDVFLLNLEQCRKKLFAR